MSTLKVDAIRHNSATSDAITTAADGTCTAKLTSVNGGQLSHRNIIINGAMTVAQAGTSGNMGIRLVDRFGFFGTGLDETPTQAQADVASGTTPYTLGFRKCLKMTNGNQTSGAGAADRLFTTYGVEAQDLATSGWNYTSSSSYVTLSFWVKSSVAQTFHGYLSTADGTQQGYSFETGSLTANTWTKVTKIIPGNSNITIDNDNGSGLSLIIGVYWGTNFTDAGNTMNQWTAYSSTSRMPDNITTWYTTNDATFEFTGVQLEVGDTATSFEHRTYGEELARCQRYYERIPIDVSEIFLFGVNQFGSPGSIRFPFKVSKRAVPGTVSIDNGNFSYYAVQGSGSNGNSNFTVNALTTEAMQIKSTGAAANTVWWCNKTNTGYIDASAEL